ncbi:restriction endonuclease subunit S [Shewanella algae]|uniref:restriction endonuclease subunit S n=1 Tax=Shewanella algae TaxID=38313 RepID=UPI001AAD9641|nr:restriction endonuclease subunit S [Shewanella algae]MBO2685377.1 restriction endonuclease subunit S [Shewanella algae]
MSNQVPEGWKLSKIAEISSILDSKRVPLNSQERAKRVGEYPYYGANGVQGYIDDFIFEGEHVLLAEDGGNFEQWATRPISYLVDGKFWVNNHAHILKAKKNHSTKFIHYSLVHKNILKHINGGTRAKLNQADMRDIQVLCPPFPEQQKIAKILTSVDEVIEKTQAQIDKLKDLKTGMMQELLTQGVGVDGKPHTEFKDSPVGRIPKAWSVAKLESVAVIQTGAAKSSKLEGDLIELPYLRVANVQDGYLDLNEIKTIKIPKSKSERFLLRAYDVLVNEGGDFDKLGRGSIWLGQISPCVHQNHVFAVRTNVNKLSPSFFNHLSGSEYGKKYYLGCAKQTTNLASINSTQLKQFPVLLPSIEEQGRICSMLDSVDSRISKHESKLRHLESLKKALMQDLLTGKVRVTID